VARRLVARRVVARRVAAVGLAVALPGQLVQRAVVAQMRRNVTDPPTPGHRVLDQPEEVVTLPAVAGRAGPAMEAAALQVAASKTAAPRGSSNSLIVGAGLPVLAVLDRARPRGIARRLRRPGGHRAAGGRLVRTGGAQTPDPGFQPFRRASRRTSSIRPRGLICEHFRATSPRPSRGSSSPPVPRRTPPVVTTTRWRPAGLPRA
jgi:hypothetical protein